MEDEQEIITKLMERIDELTEINRALRAEILKLERENQELRARIDELEEMTSVKQDSLF